jgi:CRISPR-associated protein Cmr5
MSEEKKLIPKKINISAAKVQEILTTKDQTEVKTEKEFPTASITSKPTDEPDGDNTMLTSRSQRYAAAVYSKVKAIKDDPDKSRPFYKKYGGMAHKLPVLIRTAGLVQALAFVEEKSNGNAAWRRLLDDLYDVVGKTNDETLFDASIKENLFSYMHLTRKTMDALIWFKRFAVSVLDVKLDDLDIEDDDIDAEEQTRMEEGAVQT